jgi:hypothetical protein
VQHKYKFILLFILVGGPEWVHHASRQSAETSVQSVSVLPNNTPLGDNMSVDVCSSDVGKICLEKPLNS